ncbi:TRAP transporter large permease [Pusillimonas sp. DMV24BSW_D]|uniref:TRAP transporter large permease n=1 Tax=Neopusillimonas aestuarii TaxID=2716226 RepID=UPI00140D4821|nr:TRAP transporter large permease [Pusillimonas sp. DMV24BSW_D]QIM48808.1 TRAP transporter large permease [Pusillimonas sp. DMV24BSW_D]
MYLAIIGFCALIALSFTGIPLAYASLIVGIVGFGLMRDFGAAFTMAGQQVAELFVNPNLVVVPLFILMGELIRRSNVADELYAIGNVMVGRFRGGLAMATILACGAFSAVCGSSVAAAASMTKVSMPPMRRHGYKDSISAGSVAAGGTLGILIPPSIPMVIYCIFAREDIGLMFAAGVVPGLLLILVFLLAIRIWIFFRPQLAPLGEPMSTTDKIGVFKKGGAFLLLFIIVLGGIYVGVFTPTEAASVGAAGAWLIAIQRGYMRRWREYVDTFSVAASITAAIFLIAACAMVFAQFINLTGLPFILVNLVDTLNLSGLALILIIGLFVVVLGMIFESLGILVLIVPMFIPALVDQGVNLIWFGVLVMILIEVGLITPPVGINVFTVKSASPDLKLMDIFAGVFPFVLSMFVVAGIIIAFPGLVLWLPDLIR